MRVTIPTSAGDLVDRITILEVKRRNIADKQKLVSINKYLKELAAVRAKLPRSKLLKDLQKQLFEINQRQWQLEDSVRAYLRDKKINAAFAKLVRNIHTSNDKRANIKRKIDEHTRSTVVEEKQYVS